MSKQGSIINIDLFNELYNETKNALERLGLTSIPSFDNSRRYGQVISGNDSLVQNINIGLKRLLDSGESYPSDLIISTSKPFINNVGQLLVANDYEKIIVWLRTLKKKGSKVDLNLTWENEAADIHGFLWWIFISIGDSDGNEKFIDYYGHRVNVNGVFMAVSEVYANRLQIWMLFEKGFPFGKPTKSTINILGETIELTRFNPTEGTFHTLNNDTKGILEKSTPTFVVEGMIFFLSDVLSPNMVNRIKSIKNLSIVPVTIYLI